MRRTSSRWSALVVFLLALTSITVVFIAGPTDAMACTCPVASAEVRFERSDAVYEVVPVEQYVVDGRVLYDAVVTDVWKGRVDPTVVIEAGYFDSPCGPPIALPLGSPIVVGGTSSEALVLAGCGVFADDELATLVGAVAQPTVDDASPRFVAAPALPAARIAVFNESGRLVGFGGGDLYPGKIAFCHDSGRLVELSRSGRTGPFVAFSVRNLSTLEIEETIELRRSVRSRESVSVTCVEDSAGGPTVVIHQPATPADRRAGRTSKLTIHYGQDPLVLDLPFAQAVAFAETSGLLWVYSTGSADPEVSMVNVDRREVTKTIDVPGRSGVIGLDGSTGGVVVVTRTSSEAEDGYMTWIDSNGEATTSALDGFRRLWSVDAQGDVLRLTAWVQPGPTYQLRDRSGEVIASDSTNPTQVRSGPELYFLHPHDGLVRVSDGQNLMRERMPLERTMELEILGVLPPGLPEVDASSLSSEFTKSGSIIGDPIDPEAELARRSAGRRPDVTTTIGHTATTRPPVTTTVDSSDDPTVGPVALSEPGESRTWLLIPLVLALMAIVASLWLLMRRPDPDGPESQSTDQTP